MKIEIITTGDEIMSGVTLDTNFHWAAEKLLSLGFDLRFHTSVGDDEEAIIEALRTAKRRSQAVIVSGGLGPTPDDLTAEVASRFFGIPLELNDDALQMIEERFKEQGRKLLEINKKQAYMPKGSQILKNFWGTAPGLKCIEREGVKIGYRPNFPEIHIRVSGYGDTEEKAEKMVSEVIEDIVFRLGEYVFSTEGETLEEVVGKLLSRNRLTLALAESCTGGLVAHRVTNVSGSSNYFERGIVSYSNESKVEVLGVPKELIESFGAVSKEVVEAMAEGVRKLAKADIGVSISGIAGPTGGTPTKPVGTVFIGISHEKNGTSSQRFQFKGTREEIKLIASEVVLDRIRKFVLNNV